MRGVGTDSSSNSVFNSTERGQYRGVGRYLLCPSEPTQDDRRRLNADALAFVCANAKPLQFSVALMTGHFPLIGSILEMLCVSAANQEFRSASSIKADNPGRLMNSWPILLHQIGRHRTSSFITANWKWRPCRSIG